MDSPTVLQLCYTLPDLLAAFPWPRNLSEYYHECKAESTAWTESFKPFDEEGIKRFNKGDFSLLAAHVYSPREKELIRLGCDLMNLFYVFDEYTDIADDTSQAERIRAVLLDAVKNPHKESPADEIPLGAMAQDFWKRASGYASPGAHCMKHFIDYLETYTAAITSLAVATTLVASPASHFVNSDSSCLRRQYHHPRMAALRQQATELVAVTNDIYSYAIEKVRGLEINNSVEMVMAERNADVQGAMNWLGQFIASTRVPFLDNAANMPYWGDGVDGRVKIYINSLAQWVRGNDDWAFEGGRYFGKKGPEIQRSRIMTLEFVAGSKDCAKRPA
ncbi:isoprenoid synthase domain-containing protein [Gymnopilus junonius]|uniref:Isoprenoid synthase domain-containing protein n=1 Tax=Gymnopilus junonius TaxID=109634 RepID=A0A9P5NN34_GYMJU|nr:isoprenoid synthase domain-containing protein [Gymnopilus junonius]